MSERGNVSTKTPRKRRDLTGWKHGVADAIARLEREADRWHNANLRYANSMEEAADLLRRLRPSKR